MNQNSKEDKHYTRRKLADIYYVSNRRILTFSFGYDEEKDKFITIEHGVSTSCFTNGLKATEKRIQRLKRNNFIDFSKYRNLLDMFSEFDLFEESNPLYGKETHLTADQIARKNEIRKQLLQIAKDNIQ